MKKHYALFPILAVIYPSLFLYVNNINEIEFITILPYLGFSILGILPLMAIFYLLTKNLFKSALYTIPFIVFFFTLGHMDVFLMDKLWEQEASIGVFMKLLKVKFTPRKFYAFWLVLANITFLVFWIKKVRKFDSEKATKVAQALFAMTIVLNLLSTFQLSSLLFVDSSTKEENNIAKGSSTPTADAKFPDIYYLIPDGYPRADVLKNYYKFDNSPYENSLKKKGFFVATKSYSNYATTFQSLASSLNMRYINYFAERNGIKSKYTRNVYDELANNEVIKYLKGKGYVTYHYQNSWEGARKNNYADVQIPCLSLKEIEDPFKNLFVNSTALIMLKPKDAAHSRHKCHMNNMNSLNKMPEVPGPKFVYAHFRAPHPPYLFDRTGKWIDNDLYTDAKGPRIKAWFHFNLFIDQMLFMNKQFEELVTNIQKNKKRPAIIIIQSDHGARINNSRKTFKFRKGRHSNFIAISLNDNAKLFKNDISPVNIFPTIFNHLFGDNLPIRENKYYYTEYNRPYKFTEMKFD